MRRTTPPRERRGGTCPPARPGGSYTKQMAEVLSHFGHLSLSSYKPPAAQFALAAAASVSIFELL
jgi:hypothetical protein